MSCKGETGQISTTEKELGAEVKWSIQNFSALSAEDWASYDSPRFSIGGHDWRLIIFPNGASGYNTSGRIHFCLLEISSTSGVTEMHHFSLSLQHVNGERECEQKGSRCFKKGWDFHEFPPSISREELLRRRRELLPSDVLTVVLTVSRESPPTSASVTPTAECRHCKKNFAADSLPSHQRKCDQRPVICPDCRRTVPLQKFLSVDHECEMENAQGNSSRVECCLCRENYDNESITSHLQRCMQRTVQCPRCLEEVLLQKWIDGHQCRRTEGVARKIPYSELRRVTGDFSHELGSGGFGTVFKGEMDDGGVTVQVAVKKLQKMDRQFETELKTLFSFKHEFLLSMLGYCDDPAHPCLVLECMENGSLQDRLACKDNTPPLAWDVRLLIAYCSALGINHLHSKGQVHRDVKTANILLDKDMFPKVADFGLVRIGESGTSGIVQVTGNVFGTPEYMAPEACYGDVSVKLDTFSFGVVLLELLTGLPSVHQQRPLFLYEDNILDMLDSRVCWDRYIAEKLHEISKLCFLKKEDRPTLSQILDDLPASARMLCTKLTSR